MNQFIWNDYCLWQIESKLYNMKRSSTLFALAMAAMMLTSCAPKLVPFTQTIREEYKLDDAALRTLQFYISHEIVLNKAEVTSDKQGNIDGVLTIESGRTVEQVIFEVGTKCLVKSVPNDSKLRIYFEADDAEGLMFGTANRTVNERYSLMSPDWEESRGKIMYKGSTYYTSKRSGDTYLQIRMKKLNKLEKSRRVVKGVKI